MSRILKEVLAANASYASTFDKADLAIPPARRFAVLTCMDARMDPANFAGLAEGDAHVIRNAGGRASDDAIRSLVISHKLLGTQEWFVIHHTDCGMGMFTEDTMRTLLATSLDTAKLESDGWHDTGKGPGSVEGEFIDWLTFKDPIEAVVSDVRRIRSHPLVADDVPIYGYIYDVKTGRLEEVPEAMAVGAVAKKRARASARKTGSAGKAAPAKKPATTRKTASAAKKAAPAANTTAAKKAAPAAKKAAPPKSDAAKKAEPAKKGAGKKSGAKSGKKAA